MRGDIPYTVGQQLDQETFQALNEQQRTNIDIFQFTSAQTSTQNADGS